MNKLTLFICCSLFLFPAKSGAQGGPSQRWYNYGQYLANTTSVDSFSLNLWGDNSGLVGSGSGTPVYAPVQYNSVGMSFAPVLDAWNNVALYGLTLKVGPTDTFKIDSVRVRGAYMRPLGALYTDHLVFTLVYGNGTTATNLQGGYVTGMTSSYGVDTLRYLNMAYDSINNMAKGFSGSTGTVYTDTVPLSMADTSVNFDRTFRISDFVVPAGNCVGMSLSFISGAPLFTTGDTIVYASGAYKYGDFVPRIKFAGTSASPAFAPYNPADSNTGYFASKAIYSPSFPQEYTPHWGFTGGASNMQYPDIGFHVNCAGCKVNDSISGITNVCVGSTTSLTCSPAGGTWSSTNTSIATVGSTGIVTGVSPGTTTIKYHISGFDITTVVTVAGTVTGDSISGPSIVCVGSMITLSDPVSGGIWSSGSTGIATIGSSTGVVTGIALGTSTISYNFTSSCGPTTVTKTISVSNATNPGVISGPTLVYAGGIPLILADPSGDPGGSWSSSNAAVATIGSSTGSIIGVAAGTTTITYSVTGCGGAAFATQIDTVVNFDGISGRIFFDSGYSGIVKVWLITYNASSLTLSAFDSMSYSCAGTSVDYEFVGVPTDSFRVKAAAFGTTGATGPIPTYHDTSYYWNYANIIAHTSGTVDSAKNINMLYGVIVGGPGFIGGNVTTGANRGTSGSIAVVGLNIVAINTSTNTIAGYTATNSSGNYSFSGLPYGTYTIFPDSLNYLTTPYTNITLNSATPTISSAGFIQHTISKTITPGDVEIHNIPAVVSSVSVFPNPTPGKLSLFWNETATEKATITVCDITGREIYGNTITLTEGSGVTPVDLSAFSNGLYMMTVKSASINYNNKIEIQH